MNFKRILVGAGLIVWAILAYRFVPMVWVSIVGTYVILAVCAWTLVGFWNLTAWKVMFSGWGLWWLVWLLDQSRPIGSSLTSFGGQFPTLTLIGSETVAHWEAHLLGMTLTGLTALVVWKMGESWHAQDYPEHFDRKYLNALRD